MRPALAMAARLGVRHGSTRITCTRLDTSDTHPAGGDVSQQTPDMAARNEADRQRARLISATHQDILTHIYEEFWQTNAFFTALLGLFLAGGSTVVIDLTDSPNFSPSWSNRLVGAVFILLYLALDLLWYTTIVSHRRHISFHRARLLELEPIADIDVQSTRAAASAKMKLIRGVPLPSSTRLWQAVPVLFIPPVVAIATMAAVEL